MKEGCSNEKGENWIKHYSSSHEILLVGEGDFSFSASLAKAFRSAIKMVSTSLDNKEVVMVKHPTAKANLEELEELGCTIVHEVDAHTMSQHPSLTRRKFDRIIFNFPHAGYHCRWEHEQYQILLHQEVVKGFFRSSRDMLTRNGEVHVTHKTAYPFSKWEIEKLAEKVGLCLVEQVASQSWIIQVIITRREMEGEAIGLSQSEAAALSNLPCQVMQESLVMESH